MTPPTVPNLAMADVLAVVLAVGATIVVVGIVVVLSAALRT